MNWIRQSLQSFPHQELKVKITVKNFLKNQFRIASFCFFCYNFSMVQIFGTTKSFDTKKAQMWFKERRIPFQFVDLKEKLISRGEFESVVSSIARAAGSRAVALELMADKKSKDYASFAYLDDSDKEDKLFENQLLLNLPICRNGKTAATCGLDTKTWEEWK